MGEIVPFPEKKKELSEEQIRKMIQNGEAKYLGRFERGGELVDLYRIVQGDTVTIVFDTYRS